MSDANAPRRSALIAREHPPRPRHWRSLAEYRATAVGDTPTQPPAADDGPVWQAAVSRRRALALMAGSLAAGGLAGCGPPAGEEIVPYVELPEHLVPGRPQHYASAVPFAGYAHGVVVESHQGRPVKIDGLPGHPTTLGACDSVTQAAVLSLYDPDRSRSVRERGRVASFDAFLGALRERRDEWERNQGEGLRLLTGTVTSPSEAAALDSLLARWPRARWHAWEAVDRDGVYAGSAHLFGRELEPVYRFDDVRVVVSLDADFMQTQPGFLRYAADFMARRRPVDREGDLARLYAIESTPGLTGAVADHTRALPYPQVAAAARQLARALELPVTAPEEPVLPPAWLEAVVADLRAQRGAALVIPGDQQPAVVHVLAHAINQQLGAFGRHVAWIPPVPASRRAGTLGDLVADMRTDRVSDLLILETNPAYTAPADLEFEAALGRVAFTAHWGEARDETAHATAWHVPATHVLETWGDARAHDGTVSLIQPLIEPLGTGRTALQLLHAVKTGAEAPARTLLREFWRDRHTAADGGEDGRERAAFEAFWRASLRLGMIPATAFATVDARPREGWQRDLPASTAADTGLIAQFAPDPVLLDGRHANNGWLQELPRPITKLTWGNAVSVAPALAGRLGLDTGDRVRLEAEGDAVELPVYVLPGQPEGAVSVHLGYGRRHAGRVGTGIGVDVQRLRRADAPWAAPVRLAPTGGHEPLAVTQAHHAIEGRDLIRAAPLAEYLAQPGFADHGFAAPSLYPEPWPAARDAEPAWGMSIDLSACIGCNACVTACQAENNIPVVGPEEVRRGREMHWLRIDRYFEGPPEAPNLVFQPVPCMHCENAPCEPVCPVGATQHTAAGLNEMIYQRCVGTRYCSQNCPYKVRRFNWLAYATEDTGAGLAYDATRPQRNPDVSVRPRGVMEKCTYCVQRISAARIEAGAENRAIRDGEVRTACQDACPTRAIVFGDIADPTSEVARRKAHPLDYAMLEHLNTRPRTTYLAAVRHPRPGLDEEDA